LSEILEPINDDKIKEKMNEFLITHEKIEEAYEEYSYAILDTFDHCLNEEEAGNLLSSFKEHNLKKKHKFIKFIKLADESNDNEPIIVNMPFNELVSTYILHILNMLDYTDKVLFI
jgi:hypothetical protein